MESRIEQLTEWIEKLKKGYEIPKDELVKIQLMFEMIKVLYSINNSLDKIAQKI